MKQTDVSPPRSVVPGIRAGGLIVILPEAAGTVRRRLSNAQVGSSLIDCLLVVMAHAATGR